MQSFLKKKIYLPSHSTWSVWVETTEYYVPWNIAVPITLHLECVSWNIATIFAANFSNITLHLECVSWNKNKTYYSCNQKRHTPLGVCELKLSTLIILLYPCVTLHLECVSWNSIPLGTEYNLDVTLHLECMSWNIYDSGNSFKG